MIFLDAPREVEWSAQDEVALEAAEAKTAQARAACAVAQRERDERARALADHEAKLERAMRAEAIAREQCERLAAKRRAKRKADMSRDLEEKKRRANELTDAAKKAVAVAREAKEDFVRAMEEHVESDDCS